MDKDEPDVLIPLTSMGNYTVANGPSEVLFKPTDDHEDWREALNAINGIDVGLIDVDDDETVPGGSQPRTNRDSEPEFDNPDTGLDPGLLDPQPELGRGGDVEPRRRPPDGPDCRPSSFPKPPYHGFSRSYQNYSTNVIKLQMPQVPGMYAVKKNIAQGMMDIALLTANGSQLRYVLRSNAYDAYYYISIVLIAISIFLQIVVGFALVLNNNAEQNGIESKIRAKRINNTVVALIFLITVVNIFIASFGVEGTFPRKPYPLRKTILQQSFPRSPTMDLIPPKASAKQAFNHSLENLFDLSEIDIIKPDPDHDSFFLGNYTLGSGSSGSELLNGLGLGISLSEVGPGLTNADFDKLDQIVRMESDMERLDRLERLEVEIGDLDSDPIHSEIGVSSLSSLGSLGPWLDGGGNLLSHSTGNGHTHISHHPTLALDSDSTDVLVNPLSILPESYVSESPRRNFSGFSVKREPIYNSDSPKTICLKPYYLDASSPSPASPAPVSARVPHRRASETKQTKAKPLPVEGSTLPKPAYSYSCLIALALKNSRTGCLPVSEIYRFMCQHFPYFKTAPAGWKNSVRHNLSLNKCFEKIEKPSAGANTRKGCLWALNPAKVTKMDDEVAKWSRKDPSAIRRAMAFPDILEVLERGELKLDYGAGASTESEDEETEEATSTALSFKDRIFTSVPDPSPEAAESPIDVIGTRSRPSSQSEAGDDYLEEEDVNLDVSILSRFNNPEKRQRISSTGRSSSTFVYPVTKPYSTEMLLMTAGHRLGSV